MPDDLEHQVRKMVSEILEIEPGEIDGEAMFVQDLGMDSMMALELLASLEKKYRIVIPEETLPKFTTLNRTIEIVKEILSSKN